MQQRFGILYGTVSEEGLVEVEAIYEPPQELRGNLHNIAVLLSLIFSAGINRGHVCFEGRRQCQSGGTLPPGRYLV